MNKIIIAMDSFKGSMRSREAGEAVKRAAEQIYPDSEIKVYPMADGGEGTVEALTKAADRECDMYCDRSCWDFDTGGVYCIRKGRATDSRA